MFDPLNLSPHVQKGPGHDWNRGVDPKNPQPVEQAVLERALDWFVDPKAKALRETAKAAAEHLASKLEADLNKADPALKITKRDIAQKILADARFAGACRKLYGQMLAQRTFLGDDVQPATPSYRERLIDPRLTARQQMTYPMTYNKQLHRMQLFTHVWQ